MLRFNRSQVLLANKLDGNISLSHTIVAMPLLISHVTLIVISFNAKDGNRCKKRSLNFTRNRILCNDTMNYRKGNINCTVLLIPGWFGIRKDFCHFLLGLCPLLQEYGNISYQPRSDQDQPPSEPMVSEKNEKHVKKIDLTKPVVPIISIDMPD